jgi:Flp pilus assembly protein TadG
MKMHMPYRSRLRLRRLVRSESGAELIEFSLTLPLLLLIVLGIIEFGLVFREYEIITNAAREGARIAILPSYGSADVTARVNNYLQTAGLTLGLATVTPGAAVPTPVGATCVSMIPVTVQYVHAVPFLSGIMTYFGATFGTMTLTATSSMRTEIAAGACP